MRWSVEEGRKRRPPRLPSPWQQKFLASGPELDEGSWVLARAYAELSTCCALGFSGRGPIPATAIWDWCARTGLAYWAAEHAERVIRAVDAIFLRRQAAEIAAARQRDQSGTGRD